MRSQPEETKLFTGKFDSPLAVAKQALRSMEKGKLVTGRVKGLMFMMHYVLPFLPRKITLGISRSYMEQS